MVNNSDYLDLHRTMTELRVRVNQMEQEREIQNAKLTLVSSACRDIQSIAVSHALASGFLGSLLGAALMAVVALLLLLVKK